MTCQCLHQGRQIDSFMAGIEHRKSLAIEAYDDISARIEYMRYAWRRRIDTVAKHNIALAYRHTAKSLAALPQLGQLKKVAFQIAQVNGRSEERREGKERRSWL